jgi:hypothetical protein
MSRPLAPLPVADWPAVRATIAAKIERLTTTATAAADHATRLSHEMAPMMEIGGIRSRSPRQRERLHAAYDRDSRTVVANSREVKRLEILLNALDKAVAVGPAAQEALATGTLNGRRLTRDEDWALHGVIVSCGRTMRSAIREAKR